jgi:DNA polymerase-4
VVNVRLYLHFDIDAFFASVETALRAGLDGTAVVVGGRGRRGVVSCANYAARALGIHAAMPMYQARRPGVSVFGVRHHAYRAASEEIEQLFATIGDVDMRSIDEGCVQVDVDDDGIEELVRVVENIRRDAVETYGLNVSVGVAGSATVAKIASGRAKPGGLLVVAPGDERAFLLSGDLEEIPGLGPRTRERLADAGICTVEALDGATERSLRGLLGVALAAAVRHVLAGRDPLEGTRSRTQVSSSTTFEHDLENAEQVEEAVLRVLADAWRRLDDRAVRSITLRVVSNGQLTSRSRRLDVPTEEPRNLTRTTLALLTDLGRRTSIGPVRLVSVSLEVTASGGQGELFDVDGPEMPRTGHREVTLGDTVFRGMRIEHQVFGSGRVTGAGREGLIVRFGDVERLLDPATLGRESWLRPATARGAQSNVAAVSASANDPNPPVSS